MRGATTKRDFSPDDMAAIAKAVSKGPCSEDRDLVDLIYRCGGKRVYSRFEKPDADDCMLDICFETLRMLRKREIQQPAALGAYINRIVHFSMIRTAQRLKEDRQFEPLESCEDDELIDPRESMNPETRVLERMRRPALLAAALRKLSQSDREVFIRTHFLEQTPVQIGRILGLSARAVQNLNYRIKNRFRIRAATELLVLAIKLNRFWPIAKAEGFDDLIGRSYCTDGGLRS